MSRNIIIFILVVVIMTSTTILGTLFFKSVDPYTAIKAFAKGETNLVIEDNPIETSSYPIVTENKILISVDVIEKYIYKDIEISEEYDRLYVNIEHPQFTLEDESLNERIKEGLSLNFLTEEIDGTHYLNIKGLEKVFDIKVNYIKNSDVLVIDKIKEVDKIGEIKKTTYLRPKKSSFTFKLDKLKKGDVVKVFEKDKKWSKVRTEKGYVGYVLNKYLNLKEEKYDIERQLNSVREDWNPNGKINLVWQYVGKYSPDLSKEDTIEGLDIISPTWFSIVSSNGYVVNNGDVNYVEEAHKKGYKVWGLIDNSFDKEITKGLLADEEAQDKVISQIIIYSSIYNLDGINIDFENVYYEDKDRLTNFVEKLTKELKKQNIIVSMDMTVPSLSKNWSMFYDREKLGQILDYCVVMTYDEHWASSPKSGSVASLGWVKRGIEKTLKYIPSEKLIMGIPFYTREWEESIDENGKIKVKSRALSMEQVENTINENNASIIWLDDVGQYYAEYTKDGKKYRIWIENENSIELKASLVHQYNLAGTASWRKGFEKETVWTVLNNIVKEQELVVEKQ